MLLQIQLLRQPAWIVLYIKTLANGSGIGLREALLLIPVITLAGSQYYHLSASQTRGGTNACESAH